jgi:nitrate/nitrite transporter NarK
MTATDPRPRNLWRSTGAILLAFVIVVAISLATDQVFHVLEVYPPWGEPMNDPGLNLLALSYRCVYGVLGGYLAARFAPRNPMRHAIIIGAIGFVVSAIGAIGAIQMKMGPSWYPITLALTALPTAWLGGVLHRNRQQQRSAAAA